MTLTKALHTVFNNQDRSLSKGRTGTSLCLWVIRPNPRSKAQRTSEERPWRWQLSTFPSNLTKLWRICTNPGAICARTAYTRVTVLLKVPSEFDYFCKWDFGFLNAFPKIYKTILPSLVSECRLLDFDLQRHFRLGKVLSIAFRSLLFICTQ